MAREPSMDKIHMLPTIACIHFGGKSYLVCSLLGSVVPLEQLMARSYVRSRELHTLVKSGNDVILLIPVSASENLFREADKSACVS